jgi:hypothetical protein
LTLRKLVVDVSFFLQQHIKGENIMAKYKFLALTKAQTGREEEFDKWYDRHVVDVVAFPGVEFGQKFHVQTIEGMPSPNFSTLAIYDVETDDPNKMMADFMASIGTERLPVTDAADPTSTVLFVAKASGPKAYHK